MDTLIVNISQTESLYVSKKKRIPGQITTVLHLGLMTMIFELRCTYVHSCNAIKLCFRVTSPGI